MQVRVVLGLALALSLVGCASKRPEGGQSTGYGIGAAVGCLQTERPWDLATATMYCASEPSAVSAMGVLCAVRLGELGQGHPTEEGESERDVASQGSEVSAVREMMRPLAFLRDESGMAPEPVSRDFVSGLPPGVTVLAKFLDDDRESIRVCAAAILFARRFCADEGILRASVGILNGIKREPLRSFVEKQLSAEALVAELNASMGSTEGAPGRAPRTRVVWTIAVSLCVGKGEVVESAMGEWRGSRNSTVGMEIASAMRLVPGKGNVQVLEELAQHGDSRVVAATVAALGSVPGPEVERILGWLLVERGKECGVSVLRSLEATAEQEDTLRVLEEFRKAMGLEMDDNAPVADVGPLSLGDLWKRTLRKVQGRVLQRGYGER